MENNQKLSISVNIDFYHYWHMALLVLCQLTSLYTFLGIISNYIRIIDQIQKILSYIVLAGGSSHPAPAQLSQVWPDHCAQASVSKNLLLLTVDCVHT